MFFKTSLKILSSLGLAALIYFVGFQQGCSPLTFDSLKPLSCDELPAGCKKVKVSLPPEPIAEEPGQETPRKRSKPSTKKAAAPKAPDELYWKYNYHMSLGEVAFLFVLDISSSTAIEHRSLAKQLSQFLRSIKHLKYHIAIITMDISSSPNNPVRGAYYQDGKFIPIGGRPYLTNTNLGFDPDPSVVASFRKALEREETIRCDMRNQPKESGDKFDRLYRKAQPAISCPSSDERGTYAINLALQNPAYREFFNREHVLFIPITDEDIRSGEEYYNQPGFEEYQLEDLDKPETLVNNIFSLFPRSRTFSFHPIIIEPGDKSCLTEQSQNRDRGHGSGRGYYGRLYAKLAQPERFEEYGNFIEGSIISICDSYYRAQLGRISLAARESKIPLPCYDPERIQLFVNGRRAGSDYRIEDRTLYISSDSDLNLSSRVDVEVFCKERKLIEPIDGA